MTVRVGNVPDRKDFVVHESFQTSRSEFFRRAMNGKWAESETRIVQLPDDKPHVFALYVNFIYTGQLPTMVKSKEELAVLVYDALSAYTSPEYDALFCLHILAEKVRMLQPKTRHSGQSLNFRD